MSRPRKKHIKCIGYRIKLYPNKEQEEVFRKYFNACRYVYNLGIYLEEDHYKRYKEDEEKFSLISYFGLERKLCKLKKTEEYSWLNDFDYKSIALIMKDVINAYERFFDGLARHPKYHKKKYRHQMFAIRTDRLSIQENTVKLPSIGIVSCDRHNHPEIIGSGNKDKLNSIYRHYYNARVIFDGYNYWLSFTLEESHEEGIEANSCKRFKNNEIWQHKKETEGIGIDWGSKKNNWFVDSRGNRISQPDCSKEEKQIKKYQRKFARQKRVNDEKFIMGKKINSTITESNSYVKRSKVIRPYTKRELDTLKKLNKAYKRITNKKEAVIHDYACNLISEKPEFINMEHLIVSDMMYSKEDSNISYIHRQRHNKKIKDAMYYKSMTIIKQKCENNGVKFNLVAKDYPSTQLCSCCGHRQKIGINRTYKCPVCGLIIDRDLNAAYNIRDYVYTASPMEIDYNILSNTELYA